MHLMGMCRVIKLNQSVIRMGNTINENNKEGVLVQLGSQYEEVKQEARGIVLLEKATQNTFLLKEYTFCNEILFKNKLKQLKEQIDKGPREYVISPVRIESKVFSSFCSTSYKLYAIFEYPQVTLREEISARQKENKNFEEAELWSILQSCTNALAELNPLVSLNPNEIFITPDGHLKIINDELVDENYRAVLSEQIYYAPEKLKNFNKVDSDLNLRKQSVFSMGMTILEASLLAEVTPCYNFTECCFVEENMAELLDQLSETYSPEFLETLGNILQVNPNRRASLMQVQKILDVYWSSEEGEEGSEQTNRSGPKERILESSRNNTAERYSQAPLGEKVMNSGRLSQKQMTKKSTKQRQSLPPINDKLSSYKLQQPKMDFVDAMIPQTPKNPISSKENYLYTDPKLLQMIKKDLEDINKLKQSAFYQTSKYTYMYPQTQSILNSIKNLDSDPRTDRSSVGAFENLSPLTLQPQPQPRDSKQKRSSELPPTKLMMKKNQNDLVFTVQTYENGRRYEGTTLNGMKHGNGKLIFEDGAYYQGQFKEDKMNGKGILYYSIDSPAYDGEWYNDQFHGYGILYNQNPQQLQEEYDFRDMNEVEDYWAKYEGQFILDNKAGNGKLYLTNGEVFEGEFNEDSINGQGRYVTLNGQVIQGVWDANMLVQIFQSQ